jgi:hypothetical protein
MMGPNMDSKRRPPIINILDPPNTTHLLINPRKYMSMALWKVSPVLINPKGMRL